MIAEGRDPAEIRDERKTQPTVNDLWEQYLEEHARPHKKPGTVKNDESQYQNWIQPHLGRRHVADLSVADVSALKSAVKGGRAGKYGISAGIVPQNLVGGQTAANRVLALLSNMLTFAERNGMRKPGENPCRLVSNFKDVKRERYLSDEELARLDAVLTREAEKLEGADRDAAEGGHSPYALAAIRLLLFTGARLNEILTLKWEYIDFNKRIARLPDSKTGAKVLMLPEAAIDVLHSLPRLNSNPYVICGQKLGAHMVNLQKPWRAIRKKAGLDDVRIHDLRHTFASIAASGGQSLRVIGGLLGHTQASTTQRYAHLYDDPLRSAADQTSDAIRERITRGAQTSSNFIPTSNEGETS